MIFFRLAITSLLITVLGCAGSPQNIQRYTDAAESWVGHPASDMYDAWGMPSEIIDYRDKADILGEPVVHFIWIYENRSEEEHQRLVNPEPLPSTGDSEQDCSGQVNQWGHASMTCRDSSSATDFYNMGQKTGAGIGAAFNPRRNCRVIAEVVDNIVKKVRVQNSLCYLTDEEYEQRSAPSK